MNRGFCRIVAAGLLAGIAAHRYATLRTPPDLLLYNQHVRDARSAVPEHIGGWVGSDVRVSAQAERLLNPNLLISRHYVNVETGLDASVLLVHCGDAHDMAGHFPLRCYPAAGWKLVDSRPRTWGAGGLRVVGYEYDFTADPSRGSDTPRVITVANTLLQPGGRMFADMDGLTKAMVGAGGQELGAAQVQVYFEHRVPQGQRDAAVEALLTGYRPVIDAILSSVRR
jgi:hypothetical protein